MADRKTMWIGYVDLPEHVRKMGGEQFKAWFADDLQQTRNELGPALINSDKGREFLQSLDAEIKQIRSPKP